MSFMEPEIYASTYYAVEANHGETWIVPSDVTSAETNGDLADYVEGSIDEPDEPATLELGWLCRMQAPGYLDASDWSAFGSEQEAIDHILEFYGTTDDGPREDWEIPLELRLLEIHGLQRFQCVETFNGFQVHDRITGESRGMGDGVDTLFDEDNEEPLSPGSPGFRETWEHDLNVNPDDTLEAYFPEQYERENS